MSVKILVVGDAMLDRYWFGAADRISPEAPVPIVKIDRVEARLGGAANVAANCRALGAQVALATALGRDEAGAETIELLEAADIDVRPTWLPEGYPTPTKLRVVGRGQQVVRADFEKVHSIAVPAPEGMAALVDAADVVVISDYGKTNLRVLFNLAMRPDKTVLVNTKHTPWREFAGVDLLVANEQEAQRATQASSVAAEQFTHDIGAVLVTRAERGMTLFDADGRFDIPTVAREVFDVTGAGDTVLATLAVLAAGRMPLRQAVVYANRAAGIAVGKFGTSVVTAEELMK